MVNICEDKSLNWHGAIVLLVSFPSSDGRSLMIPVENIEQPSSRRKRFVLKSRSLALKRVYSHFPAFHIPLL